MALVKTFRIEKEKAVQGQRGASWSEFNGLVFSKRFSGGEDIYRVYESFSRDDGTLIDMCSEPFRRRDVAEKYVAHMELVLGIRKLQVTP